MTASSRAAHAGTIHTPDAHPSGANTPDAHPSGAHTPDAHPGGAHTSDVHQSGALTPATDGADEPSSPIAEPTTAPRIDVWEMPTTGMEWSDLAPRATSPRELPTP